MPLGSDWERLHPLSPLLRAGRFAIVVILLFADDLADIVDLGAGPVALLLVALLTAGGLAGWWAWWTTGYRVTADEVELRTGVIFRRDRRVPIARLESIDLARPFVARLLGLSQVRLEAVSQGRSEVRLSYLNEATAAGVRDRLRAARQQVPGATGEPANDSAVDTPVATPIAPIFQVATKELVLAVVVARGALLAPLVVVVALVTSVFAGLAGAALAAFLATVFAAMPVIAGAFEAEKLYGFTLSEAGHGLEISRGLLNTYQQVVPIDRIQAVAVIEPPLWRFFGRARLVVDVAGYRGGAPEERLNTSVLLPVAPLAMVDGVLRRVLPGLHLDGLSHRPAPVASRWRVPIRWRTFSVAMDERYAVTRRGLLRRQTDIVPHAKVQSLRVTQGPWQRPLALATLHLDTAGAQIRVSARHRDREDAERLAWASRAAATA